MMPGMGGMNPKQMQQMMKQLGIKQQELNAKRVVFELEDGNLIIDNPHVTALDMGGKKTYTVMGEAIKETVVPEEDIKMVSEQTGKSEEEAKSALEECNGDIAQAISKLKK